MCNHLGTMSKILNFLILFVLLLKCSFPENRASNNQEKKDVVVTLSCTNKEKGLITIKNNLDEAIIYHFWKLSLPQKKGGSMCKALR